MSWLARHIICILFTSICGDVGESCPLADQEQVSLQLLQVDAHALRTDSSAVRRTAATAAQVSALLHKSQTQDTDIELINLSIQPVQMPWDGDAQPLCSCQDAAQTPLTGASGAAVPDATPYQHLGEALRIYCGAGLGELTKFYVDPKFEHNHRKFADKDGWLEEAFVTYIGLNLDKKALQLAGEADLLVQSVHRFSKRPIVVANFGRSLPAEWNPERFPQMILLHGLPMIEGKSFNYNKIRAMVFAKVKTGIVVDADQWINSGADYMFKRATEEGGSAYPYPILPVHWMSRDPESNDFKGYNFKFASSSPPKRTMRWGHAHPTWTYESSGFLARWSAYYLAPLLSGAPEWIRMQPMLEDEGLFNVALWASNQTKQWCKFDIPFMGEWTKFTSRSSSARPIYPDAKWYPRGIPYMFFTAHDAKAPEVSYQWLRALWPGGQNGTDPQPAIFYDGHWFASGEDLKSHDPQLRCIA